MKGVGARRGCGLKESTIETSRDTCLGGNPFNAAVEVDDLDAITVEASDPNDFLRLDLSSIAPAA